MILGVAAMLVAIVLVGGALVGATALFQRVAEKLGAPAAMLCVAALLAGLAGAAALLLAAPDRASFEPVRLFAAGGPWQGAGPVDALRLALPERAALRDALVALSGGTLAQMATGWLAVGAVLVGIGALWRRCAGRALWQGLAAFVAMAVLTALATHVATRLLAWGMAQLGFWLLLFALLGLQIWRRRRAAAH